MGTSEKPQGVYGRPTAYGDEGFSRFVRRAFLASAGYDDADLERPVIGIADTTSDYVTCHRGMRDLIEAVKRGVLQAGGLPFVFPMLSLGEILISPTSMLYRNLLAMEAEEQIRAYPMDAVVMLGGCDKTVPAQIMAAVSAETPAIFEVIGPMPTGSWRGQAVGACTDCRRQWARHRAGEVDEAEVMELGQELCPSGGTCMVMGTASTMACVTEALGLMLPGGATPLAGSGRRLRHAVATGRRAVELARERLTSREILTPAAFRNALSVLMAVGGSTNAIVHLTAIARRARVPLALEDFESVAAKVPLVVSCKPSGPKYYMEDFDRSGGMPTLLKALEPVLDLSARGVSGRSLGEMIAAWSGPQSWQDCVRTIEEPWGPVGALAVLRGSLAPEGAVVKVAAASRELLHHRGPAVVFDSPEDAARRLDDPNLDLTADHVLVLRNSGPVGAGMPEAGSLPLPRRLAEAGVKDMVRVSDARMSGTAFGTVVLHCSPEAAVGGPLALVRDGDSIELDVANRRIDLVVDEAEISRRRAAWTPPPLPERGWLRLHAEHVLGAHLGADLDFLV
ncbi:MAG: dihydroxy-acid dehydratase [Actinomycetota bacterium]